MDIYSLKHFLAVIDYNSFSRAAFEENISQSSLSKHIMKLEKELQVVLFDRSTHKLQLTSAGRIFASYALNAVALHNQMNSSLEQFRDYSRNSLRIMTIPILHLHDIADMIMGFRKAYPLITISVVEAQISSISSALDRQSTDLAIVHQNIFPQKDSYVFNRLIDDELLLLCSVNHRFASRDVISIKEISDEHFVHLLPGVFDFFVKIIEKFEVMIEIEKNSTLIQSENNIVENLQNLSAVMPLSGGLAKRFAADERLVAIPFIERPTCPISIVYNSDRLLQIEQNFIDYAINYYKDLDTSSQRTNC